MMSSQQQTDSSSASTILRGILFRCTIRGGHARLAIIPSSSGDGVDNEDEEIGIVMIVVQIGGQWNTDIADSSSNSSDRLASNVAEIRSNIRRMCKLGNELEFVGNFTNQSNNNESAANACTQMRKFTVDYNLQSSHKNNIKVSKVAKWDAIRCQRVRCKFFNDTPKQKQQQPPTKKKRKDDSSVDDTGDNKQEQHSSAKGKQKRLQGEVLADFLLWMLSTIYDNDTLEHESTKSINLTEIGLKQLPTDQNYLFIERWRALHPSLMSDNTFVVHARNELVAEKIRKCITDLSRNDSNGNSQHEGETNPQSFSLGGILDAAGGAGHVSLALSLRGIQSTIVDPRPTIGKLPGRDRKVLKKSKSKVPFSTYRAWFGDKPKGVDTVFREGRNSSETFLPESERNEHKLPICSISSDDKLLPNCAAIVALHPDEATGIIVQTAVQNKIPFCVIPCCVFSRLYPERINPRGRGGVVSTYYELIDWLVNLHPAIRVTRLPFEGANIAVWATFH